MVPEVLAVQMQEEARTKEQEISVQFHRHPHLLRNKETYSLHTYPTLVTSEFPKVQALQTLQEMLELIRKELEVLEEAVVNPPIRQFNNSC